MKLIRAKTIVVLMLSVIMLLSTGACATQPRNFYRTLTHSGAEVRLSLKGRDENSVAEDIFTAMSRYDYALFSPDGSAARFNAADGTVIEGETNILGGKDKYVRVAADNYLYSAVMTAKNLYRTTEGRFNIATKRLKERWYSAQIFPAESLILRDIAGVQNPLLIDEYIIDGTYYLQKYVTFDDDGELNEEHTYIAFDDALGGIMCDAAARMAAGKNLSSAYIKADNTSVYLGEGTYDVAVNMSTGDRLATVKLPAGKYVTEMDVYFNSRNLGSRLFIGGIIDPRTGIPTTLTKIMPGVYSSKDDYVYAAIVVSDSGYKSNALCFSACVDGADTGDILTDDSAALIFTSTGRLYVAGDIEFELADGQGALEIIRL